MTINDVEVRQANNDEVTVGTVSEYEIKIKECVRECNIDGETKNVNSAWIGGTLNVEVNGSIVKHSFRYLDTIRHSKNGDENKKFKGIITALGYNVEFDTETKKLKYEKVSDGLIPKIEGKITWVDSENRIQKEETIKRTSEPTRVKVTSKLALQEGLNKDQSDLAFYNDLPISYISTSSVDAEDSARFTIEGVVKEIADEYNGSGSTTGRYLVDLVVPNFFDVDVFSFIMLDKWTNLIDGEEVEVTKDMFYIPNSNDSFCQLGDTVKLSGDIESHTFGTVQVQSSSKRTFGGGSQSMRNGYEKLEWTIKSGDILEGEEVYNMDIIKTALDEREIKLDNNYKKRLEDYKKAKSASENPKASASPKGASKNESNSPFGSKPSNPFGNSEKKRNPFG